MRIKMDENIIEKKHHLDLPENDNVPLRKALTKQLVLSLSAAVLGSAFQFGYNTGVINAPSEVIRQFIEQSYNSRYSSKLTKSALDSLWAFTVAIFAVGGCIGGISNGYFADRFGRKKSLLFNNILAIIGALLMGLSKVSNSFEMLIVGRFIIGVNCGLNSGLCPMYITELSPVAIRGSIGCLFQLGVTLSLTLSQILGLKYVFGNSELWPLLLGFTGVFAVIQIVLLPLCPESPRYLLIVKDLNVEAEHALRRLRGRDNVNLDIAELINEAKMEKSLQKFSIKQLFTDKSLLAPTIISIVLQLSQQLSGINAIFYYSSDILRNSGISDVENATPVIGATMIVMTLISIPLMEKVGRRRLHLIGLGGMFVFSILMTISLVLQKQVPWISYLCITSMVIYIIFFAIGPGSIPWLIVAELFSQGPRPAAISLAVLVNWSANVTVGQGFPPLFANVTKEWTFLLFTFLLALFWLFTYLYLPETKNKSIEEISQLFKTSFTFRRRVKPDDNQSDPNTQRF